MRSTFSKKEPSRLGKGLAALISEAKVDNSSKSFLPMLPIAWISPNPEQPRMPMDPKELIDLANSIREVGIIEPLLVNRIGEKEYTLIAGERRLRAAQLAELESVPAVVMSDASPLQMLQLAVIENVQRKDLNPLEEAQAYLKLIENHGLTQDEVSKCLGVQRVTVTNKIRLLKLPETMKELVLNEEVSEGHARALLGLENETSMLTAARSIIKKQLNVRETEELVRKIWRETGTTKEGKSKGRPRKDSYRTEYNKKVEKDLTEILQTDVKIEKYPDKSGKVIVRFTDDDQLQKIFEKIYKSSKT